MQNRKKSSKHKINYNKPSSPPYLGPPAFISQEVRSIRIRTIASAAITAGTITMIQLAGMLGITSTATGAGSASALWSDQFRLKRVLVWGPVATAGTPVTVQLKYVDDPPSNTQSGAPRTVSDTSVSFDRPAYVCLQPPKDNSSIYSQWMDSSLTTGVIVLTCPAGANVDFFFNFILDDQGATSAGPTITAASIAGQFYHRSITTGGGTLGCITPINGITSLQNVKMHPAHIT